VCQELSNGNALFAVVPELRKVVGGWTVDVKRVALSQLHCNGCCGYGFGKGGQVIDGGCVGRSGVTGASGVAECLVENSFSFMENGNGCSGKDLFFYPFLQKLFNRRKIMTGGNGGECCKAEQKQQRLDSSAGG